MQRNFRRGLLVCLIPCLIAGYFAARLDKYRLGIDLAGGTILVYEINQERTQKLKEAEAARGGPAPASAAQDADMVKLAAQIKKRIDPTDIKNVTVRPLGKTRVEIILPTGGAGGGRKALTTEDIEEVKRQVSQMGVLEFRILANEADDDEAIQDIKRLIDNPATKERLDEAARHNLPPPLPERTKYRVKAASPEEADVSYAWAELSAEERESLGLNNAAAGTSPLWQQLATNRNKAVVHASSTQGSDDSSRSWTMSMLLFSRDVDQASPQAVREREEKERRANAGDPTPVDEKKVEYYVLTRVDDADRLQIGGDIAVTAQSDTDPKTFNPCVTFRFNGAGARAFEAMTKRNVKDKDHGTIRNLAIVLDDKVVSAPTLQAVISQNGQITGKFDRKSVDRLVNFMRNGALSAQLNDKPVSENTIGPTLGADTIRKGTIAVAVSFGAILVFMVFYYEFAGFVACIALLANLLLTVGFMVGVNAAFTLPGLAGLVLMLGMAVDANVLIYERLREERNKGANLPTAIRNGYDHAFPTIIDTHLTSIFTAIVLYTFGNDQLKGFAITLTVGLAISLFTSLYMTRLLFDYAMHKRWITELRMRRLFERPSFNPMKYRYHFFIATSALTVLGLALFLFRGENILNVDFRGGTVYAAKLKEGEERGLITTPDGKPGFRELLSEERQKTRLAVASVRWANAPPEGTDLGTVGSCDFEITYADGETATVTLPQKPPGDDRKQVEDNVKAQAETLRDVSVEQMFLSGEDYPDGKSRYFTIRTTERQPELVRVSIDRLLRDDNGNALVPRPHMSYPAVTGPQILLTFDDEASRNQVQDYLTREFRNAGADPTFKLLTPDGKAALDPGRYKEMLLDLSGNPQLGPALARLSAAAVTGYAAQRESLSAGEATERALKGTQNALQTRPDPIRLEVFDSQLASETRNKAFYAIVASWLAIMLYLWFRFGNWTFGLAAVLCLVHDLCFTLGCIAACHYAHETSFGRFLGLQDFKIDLAAVAALLTLVGYSVSDTIVVFDRIREVRGKNPSLTTQMINDSVNQTLSRTTLAAATVFLVSIVLYFAGGEGIHLFAFVMVVGVLVGTYSSIFVAAPLLLMFGEGHHTETAVGPSETTSEPEAQQELEG